MEYKKPECWSIHTFKKGDIITRIEPSLISSPLGEIKDINFIGQKLIFLGIANGSIYLERTSTMEKILSGQTFFIPICNYEEGWSHYEEPEFMKGKSDIMTMMEKSMLGPKKSALEKMHQKALDKEDYGLASKIQKELRKLKEEEDKGEIDLGNPDILFGKLGDIFGGGMKFGPDAGPYDDPEDDDV